MKPRRLLSMLLAAVMLLTVVPLTPIVATATTTTATSEKDITLGTSAIKDPTEVTNESGKYYTPNSYIYFGKNGTTPIKWRVLDADKANDGTTAGMFLLSEYVLATGVQFDAGYSNDYQGSDAQTWCSSFAANSSSFSTTEQNAMLGIAKTDSTEVLYGLSWGTSKLTTADKVFFLSARELADYVGNYDGAPGLAAKDAAQASAWWWLRSPISVSTNLAGFVYVDGFVFANYVDYNYCVRPALNLNLSSVLFTSAAVGGKSSNAAAGGVTENSNMSAITGNDGYKLTLLDESRSSFKASLKSLSGNTATVSYSGAEPGTNEYISVIIKNGSTVKYYGRVAAVASASGEVDITLPSDFSTASGDVLCVFNEQYNGDKNTDYASKLIDVLQSYAVTVENGTGSGKYSIGETVTITANTAASGTKFNGWTSDDGVTFADSNAATTTFTMPAKAVTVKANYKDLLPGKLYVDGVDLVNGNDSHKITCSGGGTAEYDPDTQTLTLTDAKITGHTSQAMAAAGIYISDFSSDVKINLVGKNSITLTDTNFRNSGIFMWSSDNKAKLLIDGTGSLDMKLYGENTSVGLNNTNSDIKIGAVSLSFENASTTKIIHTMLHTNASIVLDGTKITSTGGYLTGITTPDDQSKNSITIKNADIDLKNTEGGIYTGNLTITNSKVTTYGGDLATICCWGNINITDSTVYANTKEDFGIYCFGTATFSGGKATVISQESDGMKANSGLVIKNGADVTVTSNEASAVFTNETVNIENGKLTANGGENGYAILARRCVDLSGQIKPTDSKTTIVFGKDIMEVNGATVTTDDWDYTTVWDDGQDDEVDYWVTQSYFTDGNGNALSSAVIETAFVVTYTDGKNGEMFADQSYIVPLGGSTPAFVGDLSDISGWTLKEWNPNVASTVTGTATYTAQWKDIAAPTGEIKLGTNSWKTFLNNITFGLFFKDTQEVTITATDNSGEDVTIEYLLSDKEISETELANQTFTAYSDKFNIEPNNEYVIYAKLTDKAGNATYINSNGIVLDNIAPVISGIADGEIYCSAQTVTVAEEYVDAVTVNGKPVTLDTNGQFTLSPAEGEQKIVVTDKAGNATEMTVTVNDGHTYEWQSENGQYWQKCTVCDHETEKSDIPQFEIKGNDTVCQGHDWEFTFTLPEGSTDVVYGYDFENKGTGDLTPTYENGVYTITIPADKIENESSFKLIVCAKTSDGFDFTSTKEVTVISDHIGGTADCTHKAKCEICGEEYGEVDANNHIVLKHTEAKAATVEAEGNIEYWHCEECDKYFSDKDGKNEIKLADTVIAKLTKTDSDNKAPQTGDNSHMALWFVLLLVSGGTLAGTAAYSKKKKRFVK